MEIETAAMYTVVLTKFVQKKKKKKRKRERDNAEK